MKTSLLMALMMVVNIVFCQDATVKELKEAADKKISKDPADTIARTWKKGGLYVKYFPGLFDQLAGRRR